MSSPRRLFHSYQTDFPVLDQDGSLIGVVTRDRLIASLAEHGVDHPVAQAMLREFPTASLDEAVFDVFLRMRGGRFKAVPVVEGDRFVGMLSVEDISEIYSLLSAAGPDLARRVPPEGLGSGADEGV